MKVRLGTCLGAVTSASSRYLLSTNLGTYFGMANTQLVLFNTLDMAISSMAGVIFAKMKIDKLDSFVLGRGFGFLVSATLTGIATGSANLSLLLLVSLVSQTIGFFFALTGRNEFIII